MSDKIKADYKNYAENIRPSDEFLKKLTAEIKEEQAVQKRKKFRLSKQIAAAAGFAVIAGVSALIIVSANKPNVSDNISEVQNYGEASEAIQSSPFENISWLENPVSPEEVPAALAEKMKSSLDYLTFNTVNKFVNTEKASPETVDEIINNLENCTVWDGGISGDTVYYMAVFSDGSVAKFGISGGEYVVFSDNEKFFRIVQPSG